MKVLVTGGAGFIGSNIVEELLKLPYIDTVRVLDNLSTGYQRNIKPFIKDDKFEVIYGDIQEQKICIKACQGIDIILHQAALGSVPRSHKEPINSHSNNVHGFITLLDTARLHGIKRFVYASSSSVYGNTKNDEDLEFCKPISFYGMTKHINDLYAKSYTDIFGMECIGLRYHNVFGKNQSLNGEYSAVIPIFISNAKSGKNLKIHGDGTQYRDFTHVENIVSANILAMNTTNKEVFGKSFDIGSDTNVSVNQLADTIIEKCDSSSRKVFVEARKGDIHGSCANMKPAKELLGYKTIKTFEDGIIKTIETFSY